MILYRPVGINELALIYDAACESYPPRLPDQPIFYPVLNFDYAQQIAGDWNTKAPGHAGYVTKFVIDDKYAGRFERQIVGGANYEELWVPAEELGEFNSHIEGKITVEAAFFGEGFTGYIPERYILKGKNAVEQIKVIDAMLDYAPFDFFYEIITNSKAFFLHFAYWRELNLPDAGLRFGTKTALLKRIQETWEMRIPDITLFG
jgi:hypothetical protein